MNFRKINNKGFTLIELMVAVGIIGLLVGLSTPNLLTMMDNERVRSGASDITTRIRQCRQNAVANAIEYRVLVHRANRTVQMDKGNAFSRSSSFASLESAVDLGGGNSQITVTFSSATNGDKVFPTNGIIVCTPEGTITDSTNTLLKKDSFIEIKNSKRYFRAIITAARTARVKLDGPFLVQDLAG